MSDEYDNETITFSPFWPLLITLVGLILWMGYQVYGANAQRSASIQQFQAAIPTIQQAENIRDKYVALMKDLVETSAKDTYAMQIVNEAKQAGLIRQSSPAAPSDADTNSAAGTAPATPPATPSN